MKKMVDSEIRGELIALGKIKKVLGDPEFDRINHGPQEALNTLRNALDYIMTSQNHEVSLGFAESVVSTKAILWNAFWAVYDNHGPFEHPVE